MKVSVILTDLSNGSVDRVDVDNIENRQSFVYLDNDNNKCEINVYDDGICLYKIAYDYELELQLRHRSFAKIKSNEGVVEIDTKVVDFNQNNDILVMHYSIDEVERQIKIIYRS